MAVFDDKIGALINEVEEQKEGNQHKSNGDILGELSAAHQTAAVLGNLSDQVEEGGLEQRIIDKTEARESALTRPDEKDGAAPLHPLRVYIGNVHDRISGFTIPLPTTMEALLPFFADADITGWQDMEILEVMSDIDGLGDLSESVKRTMSRDTVDELNYLAARLRTLQDGIGYDEMFAAVVEAKRYDGSVTGLINLTFAENLNRFDLLPAFSNEQYGDFLVNFAGDESADAFKRLDDSGQPGDKELARYIEKLEKYVDRAAYGRDAIKAENGVLTEKGLLMGGDGLQEMYHGPRDIPAEYRVFTEPGEAGKQTLKISGVDIAATVIKLHAVCGDNMGQAAENLKTLMSGQSRNYLLLIEGGNVCLSPALEAYKSGAETSAFVSSSAGSPDFMAFAVRVNKRGEDGVTGDLVELNGKALCANVSHHTVAPERIDAVLLGGQAKSYDLWSWINLPQSARGDIRSYASRFPDSGLTEAAGCYASFMDANETVSEAACMDTFLANANTAFMDAAENRRPGMIRVAKDAALEMLARGDGEVYRLIPDGVNKLVPIVAARLARYTGRCEFAVKREDLTGLDKWAERAVNKLTRQNERGERDKSIYQREAL